MRTSLLCLILAALAAAPARSQDKSGEARPWSFAGTDIPVNPRMHFGQLENGMRWVWMANPKPEERSYLRLHMNVGSFAEQDDQRGMAHFLEHMAFNGSRNFPAGTLIEWFQNHGMAFGADTNAGTDFSETTYQIDLPNSDAAALQEGLEVLSDFAYGLLIEDKEVQAEKGVIDGEERERDSAGYRMFVRSMQIAYDGTRVPIRLPIGIKSVRDAFTAPAVRKFYVTWYRPENATLVLVGDLKDLDPTPLITAAFSAWKAPAAAPLHEPARGTPAEAQAFFNVYEREIPTVDLDVARVEPDAEEPLTAAEWQAELPAYYARRIVNLRLSELAKKDGAPFLRARLDRAEGPDTFGMTQGEHLGITCKPEQWREALSTCEQELRKALTYGFQQAELDEVRADGLHGLDQAVDEEPTARSPMFVAQILQAAEERSVPADAATRRAILRPAIEKLKVEDCQKALAASWGRGRLEISALGGLDLGADAARQLQDAWQASQKVEIAKPEEVASAAFAYASKPEDAGKVAAREHIEDLDIHRVEFENGVRLWIKKTAFQDKQILVTALLGDGSLSLPPDRYPLSYVTDQVFQRCGLEAHSQDDLRRLTAGREVQTGMSVGTDSFEFAGGTTAADLQFECELLCAYLQHPGWREEGLRTFLKRVPQTYERLRHQHTGPIVTDFIPALHGGDPRFGLPPQASVEAVSIEQMRDWLTPHLQSDPLDVVMVGDLDVDAAVAAAARTFGHLPRRQAAADVSASRKFAGMRTGLRQEHSVDTQTPNAVVLVAFPTTDGIDAHMRRALGLLGLVVDDRLRLVVREKMGASYSPGASADSSTIFPGLGFVMMQAAAAPPRAAELLDACMGVAQDLADAGVTDEELHRMKEPMLKQVRDEQQTNGYWVSVLGDLHHRPAALDEVRGLLADLDSISSAEISKLAKEYMPKARASSVVVRPAPAGDAAPPSGK